MKNKNKQKIGTNIDLLKAVRKGNRDAEFEMYGPGFHSKCKIVKSKKEYNRKKYKCIVAST